MASGNIVCAVPKLTGKEDYDYWRVQMKTHLKAYNLNRFVEEDIGENVPMVTQSQDSLALSQIHQAIDISIFWRIAIAKSAKEAWDILEKTFGWDHNKNNFQEDALLHLKEKFELVKMEKYESIESYFSRLVEIKINMDLYGHSLPDHAFVEKVLNTLIPEFDHVVAVIQAVKDLSTLTPEDLHDALKLHEPRIKERIREQERQRNHALVLMAVGYTAVVWWVIWRLS